MKEFLELLDIDPNRSFIPLDTDIPIRVKEFLDDIIKRFTNK